MDLQKKRIQVVLFVVGIIILSITAEKCRQMVGEASSSKSGQFTFLNCFDMGSGTVACSVKEGIKFYFYNMRAAHVEKARNDATEAALASALAQGMNAKDAAKQAQKAGTKAAKKTTQEAKRITGPIISSGWDFFEAIYFGGTSATLGFSASLGLSASFFFSASLGFSASFFFSCSLGFSASFFFSGSLGFSASYAAKAVEALNGNKIDDKEWYVGKAQKKSEREVELKVRYEQTVKEAVDKFQGANLYVKNLDDSISDEKLRELFSPFGTIASCKVMRDPNGISRGSGFVAFSTPEEASRALMEMNGKLIVSKPLYVAPAQRKEERRARLQAQFSQMRPVAVAPSVAPRMPMYPPGGPGLGQHIFYGQAPPTIIPPQPGFGYQQQLVPGMRPGGGPMPNFFVPMVQQGQQGQRPGGRRAGSVPIQQNQQPVPLMQQQMLPRGRVYRYPPGGRGLPDVSMQGVGGGMLSVPYDMGGMPVRDSGMSQQIPVGALASALANATPDQQRTMLGENLYPLVEQLEPEMAAKVTGMLLEMDQTEVLHLLESPEALKAKVGEAMEVLRNVAQQQQQQPSSPADHLASLSLNDNVVS